MADSPLFEKACDELELATHLSPAEVRDALRIALKEAGYDSGSVNRPQLLAAVFHSLPPQLVARGLRDAEKICERVASHVATG